MAGTFTKHVLTIIRKEMMVEWRNRSAINGLLLYLVSTIFISYLSFNVRVNQLNPLTWNALYWIILLFAATNAVAKSFIQEREGRMLYYYSLFSPQELIIARMIYNALLLIVLAVTGLLLYMLVLGNPVEDVPMFLLTVLLASIGFSATLTMISAIVSRAGNNQTLMAVLGFPVILPVLLMVIKVARNALDGLAPDASFEELATLGAINVLIGAVSYVLFPYLWRA